MASWFNKGFPFPVTPLALGVDGGKPET